MCYYMNMPLPPRPDPPAGVAKITFKGVYNGTVWENVFWAKATGTFTYANVLALATAYYNAYATHLAGSRGALCTFEECIVTGYDGAGNPQASYEALTVGTDTSTALPAQSALVISWKLPATWRGGKPRTYLPAESVDNTDSVYTFTDAHVAGMQAAAVAFLTACNAITATGITAMELGTVSFQHALAWRTPPIFFGYVAGGVQKRICTQRRRLGNELF